MNRSAQIVVGSVLVLALLLWGAVWWVARDRPVKEAANISVPLPSGSRVTAPIGVPGSRSAIEAPATAREQTAPAVPGLRASLVDPHASGGPEPFKPQTEPIPPPLPPPIKPNTQGFIDLSSDPSTKAFTEALQQGYARRLAEEARRQRDAPASNP